jgi:hypothetical protein
MWQRFRVLLRSEKKFGDVATRRVLKVKGKHGVMPPGPPRPRGKVVHVLEVGPGAQGHGRASVSWDFHLTFSPTSAGP